jgi:cation transport regulator ChaC
MWYFAYGTNMERRRLELHRAIRVKEARFGVLENYRLVFNRVSPIRPTTGCANIVPAAGHQVRGILYKISDSNISRLDVFEGAGTGRCHRERVLAMAEDNDLLEAEVYIADEVDDNLEPSVEYLDAVIKAARESGLDETYIEETFLAFYPGGGKSQSGV